MSGVAKIIAVCPECGIRLELEEPCENGLVLACPVCNAEIKLEKISQTSGNLTDAAATEPLQEPETDTLPGSLEVSEPETIQQERVSVPVLTPLSEPAMKPRQTSSGIWRILFFGIMAVVGVGFCAWGGYVFFKTFRIVVRPIPAESTASAPAKTGSVSGTSESASPVSSAAPDKTKPTAQTTKTSAAVPTAAVEKSAASQPVPVAKTGAVEKNGAPASAGTTPPPSTAAAGNSGAAQPVPMQKTTVGGETKPVRKTYPAVKKPNSVPATPDKLLVFMRNWEKILDMARKGKEIRNEPLIMQGTGPLWMGFSDIGRLVVSDPSVYMQVLDNGNQIDIFALTGDRERFEAGGGPVITMQVLTGNYTTDRKITISYWKRTVPPNVKVPVLSAVTEVIADGMLYSTKVPLMQMIRQLMGAEASRPKVCIVGNNVYVVYLLSPSEAVLLKEGAMTIKITGCYIKQSGTNSSATSVPSTSFPRKKSRYRSSYARKGASSAASSSTSASQTPVKQEETALVFNSDVLGRQASYIMGAVDTLRNTQSDTDFGGRNTSRGSFRPKNSLARSGYQRKSFDNVAAESERESPSWRTEKQLRDFLGLDDEAIAELRQTSQMNTLEDIDRICNGKVQKKLESYNILKVTREINW